MANRNFPSNKIYNMHVMRVDIDMQIAIGASGAPAAPTLQTAAGVQSITRVSTGIYDIKLQDNYAKLLGIICSFQSPSQGTPSGIQAVEVVSFTNSSNPSNNNGATLRIQCFNATGTAADPANGSVMELDVRLNNSQVQ